MNQQALKEFKGKQVSIVARNLTRPCGGILKFVGEDYIVLEPYSRDTDKILISTDQIISVIVIKKLTNKYGEKNEIRQRARNT